MRQGERPSYRAIILAAGEGTRLRPLTADRPKPMLPIGGKPVLEHIVNWLWRHGITDIAINLHHKPESIIQHFGDGQRWGVRISYSREDPILGSAGAAKKLESFWDGPFVVAYGDVITDFDLGSLIDLHHASREKVAAGRPAITMALYPVPNPWECGIVELGQSGRILRFVEKPERDAVFSDLAASGIMVVDPGVLSLVPAGQRYDFGHNLFPLMIERDLPLFGHPIGPHEYLLDMGSLEKYRQAEQDYQAGRWTAAHGPDTPP